MISSPFPVNGAAWDREVEAHGDAPSALVLELVHLLVGLLAALAAEDLRVLESRRVDRIEPARVEGVLDDAQERPAAARFDRQRIGEPA